MKVDRVPGSLRLGIVLLVGVALLTAGCSREHDAGSKAAPETVAQPTPPVAQTAEEPLPDVGSPYDTLPEAARSLLDKAFTGDLDQMVERRLIRAGVAYSRTHYFIDKGHQKGMAYESLVNFEDELNKQLKTGNLRVQVAFVPLPRDMLLPALREGKVDLVAAMLSVTPERQKIADFSDPVRTGVSEILVTGPGAPAVARADDLSGREVFVRKTSSYYESLMALNERLQREGKAPIKVVLAPEELEDNDVLEMVNAGLAQATFVDDYLAEFWARVFTGLTLHPNVAIRTGGRIAVAMRPGSPKLKAAANAWIKKHGEGTLFGNLLEKRYMQDTTFVVNAASEAERAKLMATVELFRKYAGQYDLDYLLMAAQAYQESRLDQNARSRAGAVGIMQLLPSTGKDMNVGDITKLEPNIHAGMKYMRFMIDQYYKDEPMTRLDKGLMTFASYNAGPGRIRQLRREAERRGLDKNVWFGNVERVASEKIGRETVQYVSNIYKYYVAYTLVAREIGITPGRGTKER